MFDRLQKLQNRAARVLTFSRYDADANRLFRQLNWKDLSTQFQIQKALMVYKSLNDLVPGYLSSKFVKRYETRYSLGNSVDKLIGKFRIPRRPWDEHNCKANAGQLLYKNKNKHGQFAMESLENDRNLKKVRSQSLNFTTKHKGYLLKTTKSWEKLIVLNRRKKKATKPNEEVNLKRVKFVKVTIFFSL